ncbi:unnamed protein product [Rotaria sordida]|uniref:Uncharacterized protein n=1 Tax=Rotaria sordida TaxID=392033 RepID=A0A815JNU0_9BILA|nr:unnamed protein product [Rotaria sordida]
MKIGDHILVDGKCSAVIRYIGSVDGHPGKSIDIQRYPLNEFNHIKQLVVIDIDNDCNIFENLINIHFDLNRLRLISEKFLNQIKNLTNLSFNDNPTLKSLDLFISR